MHEYFKDELYLKIYSFFIYLIPSESDWEVTNQIIVLPPHFKKTIKRPKRQRKRQSKKPKPSNKLEKKREFITCHKCLTIGHNAQTNKQEVYQKSKFMQPKNTKKGID